MNARTLWNRLLRVLAASASLGTALAYHSVQRGASPDMVRRTIATSALETEEQRATGAARAAEVNTVAWARTLRRLFDALDRQAWESQRRQYEAYLAQALDLADLETRMRRLDQGSFCRRPAFW